MFKLLIVVALLFAVRAGFAQNRVVKGRVIDSVSNNAVETAKVTLFTQNNLIWVPVLHVLTNEDGTFALSPLPKGEVLKISITFSSYSVFDWNFKPARIGETNLGVILIGPNALNEVRVKDEQPAVTMRNDTVAINSAAYETPPNASVEELMKKLPGIEIDIDGTIYYNGREIKKIRLDGKEFFNNNYRIASKNLDVDMIEQIKVYDDHDDDLDRDVPNDETDKIIDITLKKSFRNSAFGKAFGGNGNANRYTSGALMIVPKNNSQISGFFQGNNLSNTAFSAFSINDAADVADDAVPINRSSVSSSISNSGSLGIKKILSGGLNANFEFKNKLKLNLAHFFTQTITTYNSALVRQQLTDNAGVNANSLSERWQKNNVHNFNAIVRWHPKTSLLINYEPKLIFSDNVNTIASISDNSNTTATPVSVTKNNSDDHNNNIQFSHNFRYYYHSRKSGSVNIVHTLSVNPIDARLFNVNSLKSFTQDLTTTTLDRFTGTAVKKSSADITAKYRYPFNKKLIGFLEMGADYAHSHTDRATYNFNNKTNLYDSFQQSLSSNLVRDEYSQNIGPGLCYSFSKGVVLAINANTQMLHVNNQFDRNYAAIDQHYINFLPSGYMRMGKYYLGYRSTFSLPAIADMVPYNLMFSQLRTVTGNPSLKPVTGNRLNFRYINYTGSQLVIHAEAIALFEKNSIFRATTINSVGVANNAPANMNGRYTINANGSISKRFKKTGHFQVSTTTAMLLGKGRGFFEVNNQGGYQNTTNISFKQLFRFNWKNLLEWEQSGKVNNVGVTYSGVGYDNINSVNYDINTHLTLFAVKYMTIESVYDHFYNTWVGNDQRKDADVLSISISRQFSKKSHSEFRLSCFDVFNQNNSFTRNVNANTITDTQSAVVNRYFMASVLFKFNKPSLAN